MSLVERFSQQAEGRQGKIELSQSICRNLEMILNARRPMPEADHVSTPESSILEQSLYGYGIRNLSHFHHSNQLIDICRDLENIIQQFEPRLKNVIVELNRIDEQSNALCFYIEASVHGENGERSLFDTTINLTNRVMVIRDMHHV